ncbi:cobalamin-binding protein [Pradoshia eiseniae]|uniref:Cobalamin-binding protein n=1 Tax=Pradoshia eiseniae TaxID=2064768 RepID=A0A2S7N053_9BACI|nr:cobalamin B12-binding domain-containing protein [Pradoshia eiseniae]PQD95365.1 cobalamin-binding protein [Pradoshia eiseniae]
MFKGTEFADILLKGNTVLAWKYIEAYKDEEILTIYEDIITPAMHRIGLLWENNKITVADEHIATAICDFVLSRLSNVHKSSQDSAPRGRAMFLCLEGEQHYLGLKMANYLFVDHGWDTKYFGPNLPLEYALQTAAEWEPDVIGLSVSIVTHLPKLKTYCSQLEAISPSATIFVGGRLGAKYDLTNHISRNTLISSDLSTLDNWLKNYNMGEKENAAY